MDSKSSNTIIEIECITPDNFESKLIEAEDIMKTSNKPLYILFTGSKALSGKSWCPDCEVAEPLILSVLSSIEVGCVILRCLVDREPYRNKEYPYRSNKLLNISCVPTLMKWENNKCIARLNDMQSQDSTLIMELVNT